MPLSRGAKALLALLGLGGGLAALAYLANQSSTKGTAIVGSSGFPRTKPRWTNEERVEIRRNEAGFIDEMTVHRQVETS